MASLGVFLMCLIVCVFGTEDGDLHTKYKSRPATDCNRSNQKLFGGQCYTVEQEKLTWNDARIFCLGTGDLAVLEKITVVNALDKLSMATGESKVWVGMVSKGSNGESMVYSWVDGTEMNDNDFKLFDQAPQEGCVAFDIARKKFETESCDNVHHFLCEDSMQSEDRMEKEEEKFNKEMEILKASSQMKEIEETNLQLIENGELTDVEEFDIKLTPEQIEAKKRGDDWRNAGHLVTKRNTISERMERFYLWKNKTVYYYIDKEAYYKSEQNKGWKYAERMFKMISDALNELKQKTCVDFIALDSRANAPRSYIHVKPVSGCYSYVGSVGGAQELSLTYGCMSTGTIQHEFMHAMGFHHEQSRPDRDSYVDILWQNIIEKHKHNFQKEKASQISTRNFGYDIQSIMQYGGTGFAKSWGLKTIVPRPCATPDMMGQRDGATPQDIAEINELYHCDAKVDGFWGVWSCWSDCSATCGGGLRRRTRQCDTPSPRRGGASCSSNNQETEKCYSEDCTGSGNDKKDTVSLGCWNDHNEPPILSETSLEGKHRLLKGSFAHRRNAFDNCFKAAQDLGHTRFALRAGECFAAEDESVYQSLGPSDECSGEGSVDAIDVFLIYRKGTMPRYKPKYGAWKKTGDCTRTCGGGIIRYTRECNNPKPVSGSGMKCYGPSAKSDRCATDPCGSDHGEWSSWYTCSKTCGTGTKIRHFLCEEDGCYKNQTASCKLKDCATKPGPINPGGIPDGGKWGKWSKCSKTCGKGQKTIQFFCPPASQSTKQCNSRSVTKECYEQSCDSGKTYGWGKWSKCSVSCGYGTVYIKYTCPPNAASSCKNKTQSSSCFMHC